MEKLFSYGSLRNQEVQDRLFGRTLVGQEDILPDYEKGQLEIEGKKFNVANKKPGSVVDGMVYELSHSELERADRYEGNRYKRIEVVLESGTKSWLYLIRN